MPYIIICSIKILTLATATFLFILVGILCKFAMVPGVYILLSPHEEEVHSLTQHIHQKDLNLCLQAYYYGKVIAELEKKTQIRNSTVFLVLIIWPRSILKFLFVFGLNECLWAFFSLSSFKIFWFYIWVVVVWLLILRHIWLYVTCYIPMPMNKKLECKDHQICSKMLRKICKKEV